MYFFPSTLFFDWEIGIDIYDRFPLDDIFQRGLEKQDYAFQVYGKISLYKCKLAK